MPPVERVLQIAGGFVPARCLLTVAELSIADLIEADPVSVVTLASARQVDAEALRRVLRLLAAHGIFALDGEMVSHTPESRLLQSAHPQSLRSMVRMIGAPVNARPVEHLRHSVVTGESSAEQAYPEGYWGYLAQHPEEGRLFDSAMAAKAHAQIASVLGSYEFSGFQRIADIGGGSGHLLRAVLDRCPRSRGLLFDQPHVIAGASGLASDRLEFHGGDFFKDRLPEADAYVLMEVIHDWTDADAVRILQSVRRATPGNGRLLLIESLIPDQPTANWTQLLDIFMLALFGGKQRTEREYIGLAALAGFEWQRTVSAGPVDILEFAASSGEFIALPPPRS